MDKKKYIPVKEAAAYLSVSPSCIYNWISRGFLAAFKFVGSVRIDREGFYRWCELNKLKS